jgi:hypothetical protein
LPVRLENLCDEWHLTATHTGKARIATRIAIGGLHRELLARKRATFAHRNKGGKEHLMLDVLMLVLGLGFFVAGIGYAYACERL